MKTEGLSSGSAAQSGFTQVICDFPIEVDVETDTCSLPSQPSVCLRLVNQQQGSALFEVTLPIFEGDVTTKIAARLMKTERSKIKGKVSQRQRSAIAFAVIISRPELQTILLPNRIHEKW